jgi:3-hydroxymyristoyl/3-hydroxydecanoyl-(acyl carrier protein) dehydratase
VPQAGTSQPASPTPTPASAPAPAASKEDEPAASPGKEVEVDALRQEYLALRDELFKSRARANAVASQLYSTQMTIKFTWGSARHYGVSKASIRVDGATVYEDSTGAIANDDGIRFNGYVAPGRHLVTFHVEAAGKDDDSFTSSTESQIVVKAVANKDLLISAKGRDSGDIAYEWKRSEKGSYGLGIDVSVKAVAAGGAKK